MDNLIFDADVPGGSGLPIGWAENASCVVVDKDCNPITDDPNVACSWLDKIETTDPIEVGSNTGISETRNVLLDLKTIPAASLVGARVWFDASKLRSLRATGPRSVPTT